MVKHFIFLADRKCNPGLNAGFISVKFSGTAIDFLHFKVLTHLVYLQGRSISIWSDVLDCNDRCRKGRNFFEINLDSGKNFGVS